MSTYPWGDSLYDLLDIKYHRRSEVVGNIFENPELLQK